MSNPKWIKLVHTAASYLGLDDDTYRQCLQETAGVHSSKDLDFNGLQKVMKRFEVMGFSARPKMKKRENKKSPSKDDKANLIMFVTPSQREKIAWLEKELGWTGQPHRLKGFCNKMLKVNYPRTVPQAQKIIEGLKGVLKNSSQEVNI